MPGSVRLGDLAKGIDAHGCKVCAHTVIGPPVQASPDVYCNGRPAVRKGDSGIHMLCCGSNTWNAAAGSNTVLINDKPAFRLHDKTRHCGGIGKSVKASKDINIGNSQAVGFKKAAKNQAPFVCNCNL